MKIVYINNDKFVVYLNKYYYEFDKNTINECITSVLKRLKKEYNVEVYSIFNIDCYINDNYGIILVIKREYDPFSMYSKKTNLNIKFYDKSLFLYELEDYFIKDKIECSIYIYNNKIYVDTKDIFSIIEHVNNILYGRDVIKVIK